MEDRKDLNRALTMARRALAILEEQAAGYTHLTIPAHLQIELEEKRRQVAELEAKIGGESTVRGSDAIFDQRDQQLNVAGDYVDRESAEGSKYSIHIEHAEGIAIGDGGQVIQSPPTASSFVEPVATATLRQMLQRLDDVELDALCLDHFPAVYDRFSRGLRRDEKLNLLLDHCQRNHGDADRLVQLLKNGYPT